MKKKILVCALIAVCLSVVAYGTTAYLTVDETSHNVITSGGIKIDLQEYADPNGDGNLVPFEDVLNVFPGMDISKIVQVQNIGLEPTWVRLTVEKSITLAEDREGEVDLSLVTYDLNTEYWTEKDGYYYYNEILKPGAKTEPLFTEVTFSPTMGNMYQESTATIKVNAFATQSANNGKTVLDAAGWPMDITETENNENITEE